MLGRVRRNGALTIRDIDDDVLREKDHEWASQKPSKRALELAFYGGLLTISRREGMLKTYELMGRHFGWETAPKAAPESARMAYLLDRALRAQGIVSLDSICHLDAPSKAAIHTIIKSRVRRQELVPVALDGAKHAHWVVPELLDANLGPVGDVVHILNPFDPLVIQRKRLNAFFGYDHRFEAYVPKEKRVYGYFSQPVLVGEEIVAVARPEDRPREGQAADAEMDLDREGRARRAAAADRGGAGAVRDVSAGEEWRTPSSSLRSPPKLFGEGGRLEGWPRIPRAGPRPSRRRFAPPQDEGSTRSPFDLSSFFPALPRQPRVRPLQTHQHEQREHDGRHHHHPRAEPARDAERCRDPDGGRRRQPGDFLLLCVAQDDAGADEADARHDPLDHALHHAAEARRDDCR